MKKIIFIGILFVSLVQAEVFNVNNTKSFREALEYSSYNGEDDTIILDKGTYLTTSDKKGTFLFSDKEMHGLTITSKNGLKAKDVILDGGNKDRVLRIDKGKIKNIYIKNISIINGNSSGGSGIKLNRVRTKEGITFENIIFKNNIAKKSGGAIFDKSKAFKKAKTSVTIKNCLFENNKANSAGALYTDGYFHLKIINSTFKSNSALKEGGAIVIHANYGVEFDNCLFEKNIAVRKGGAIYNDKDNLSIYNSKFIKNEATEAYKLGKGGIDTLPTPAGLLLKMFTSTRTEGGDGGAIYNGSNSHNRLHIVNTLFDGNKGQVSGAISGEAKAIILNSEFINNESSFVSALDISNSIVMNSVLKDNITTKEGRPAMQIWDKTFVANSVFNNKGNEILYIGSTHSILYHTNINEDEILLKGKNTHLSLRKNNRDLLKSLDDNYLKKMIHKKFLPYIKDNLKIKVVGRY